MRTLLLLTAVVAFYLCLIGAFVRPASAAWETAAARTSRLRNADSNDIKQILETGPERSYTIVWRSRLVEDQRLKARPEIRAEKEWLWRWDRTAPLKIFATGFKSKKKFGKLDHTTPNPATNLQKYVANNVPSVFVSTTRTRWTPKSRANTFRYDIFAPGGIDVNLSLGQHKWQNQNEVAFVGGIMTEYIYGAVELDERKRLKIYHLNPFYNGPDDPLAKRKAYKNLPVQHYEPQSDAQRAFYTFRSLSGKKRWTGTELMRTDED